MVGIGISVAAYVPQIVHLAKEHCSAGVSGRAWAMWVVSSLLIGTLAVYRGDPVFMALQASSLLSAGTILFFARKYRGGVCPIHAAGVSRPEEFTP